MSAAGDAIAELLTALSDERKAIRTLDGDAVARAADAKERVVAELGKLGPSDLVPYARDLAVLRGELRRNGVLLAHARTCLREATEIARGTRPAIVEKRV